MKSSMTVGLLLLLSTAVSAPAQVSVYLGIAPPPIVVEPPPPPPPVVGMVWVGGCWVPQGHHYRWAAGHYEQPPFRDAHWSHPHYDHYQQGWKYDRGHWDHDDHEDHDHGH